MNRAAALTAILIALGALAGAPHASASPRASTGAVILRGQPAWSNLGDDVQLRLGIRADTSPALDVNAVIHAGVSSRIAFERTINGVRLGPTVTSRSAPVASLPILGTDRIFTLPLQDPAAARDPDRIRLTIPGSGPAGVFPVEIELRDPDSGDVISSFVTHLVAVRRVATGSAPSNTRLQVAWLWRVAASPATTPAATPAPAFTAELGPTGRLGHQTEAMTLIGGVPVTLVPNPETVAGAFGLGGNAAATGFVAELRDVASASTTSILAGPFTTVDGPALLRAGLRDALSAQLTIGRETLERELRAAVDNTIAAPQPLDPAMLERLRTDGGTTRLVVDPDQLTAAAPADQFTAARPFRLDTGAGSFFDALEANHTTSDLLVRRGSDALRAQQVLAGLTVIALEQPNRSRGVVIDTPVLWDPSPTRVGAVLAGLRGNPVLTGTRLTDLFSVLPATVNGKPYVRGLAATPSHQALLTRSEYRTARTRVDALASMIGSGDALVVQLRHELLVTPASGVPRTGAAASGARLVTIRERAGAVTDRIIAPPNRTFRLTSRRASVPLSIENQTHRRVRVRVRLTSQKLEFPEGSERLVELPPGNTTTQFDVESRASGTFPVMVTVSSPDDGLALQRSRYTIRSAFVSGVGVFLALGAGLFLAIWWLRHWRRSRRAQSPALSS